MTMNNVGPSTSASSAYAAGGTNDMPAGTMNMADLQAWLKKRVQDEWSAVAGATQQVDDRQKAILALNTMKTTLTTGDYAATPGQHAEDFALIAKSCAPNSEEQKAFQAAADAANTRVANVVRYGVVADAFNHANTKAEFVGALEKKGFSAADAQAIGDAGFVTLGKGAELKLSMDPLVSNALNQKWPYPEVDTKTLAGYCDAVSSDLDKQNQLAVTQLQQAMNTAQEAMQTVSDIYKSSHDTSMSAVRNLV